MSEGRRRKSPLTAASSSSSEESSSRPVALEDTSATQPNPPAAEAPLANEAGPAGSPEDPTLERASKRQKQEGDQEPIAEDGDADAAGRPSRKAKDQARDKMSSPPPAAATTTTQAAAQEDASKKKKKKTKKKKKVKYCYCGEDSETPFMIQCEGACQKWYHGTCLGMLTEADVMTEIWLCNNCGGPAYDPERVAAARAAASKENTPMKPKQPPQDTEPEKPAQAEPAAPAAPAPAEPNSSSSVSASTQKQSAPKMAAAAGPPPTHAAPAAPAYPAYQQPPVPMMASNVAPAPHMQPMGMAGYAMPGGDAVVEAHRAPQPQFVAPPPPPPQVWPEDGPPEAAGLRADDVAEINAGSRGSDLDRGDEVMLTCVMPGCEKERTPFSKYCSSDCASRNGMAAQVTLNRLQTLPGWIDDNAAKAESQDQLLLELEERMQSQALERLKSVETLHEKLLQDIEAVADDAQSKTPTPAAAAAAAAADPTPAAAAAAATPAAAPTDTAEATNGAAPAAAAAPTEAAAAPAADAAAKPAEAPAAETPAADAPAADAPAATAPAEAAPATEGTADAPAADADAGAAPMEVSAEATNGAAPDAAPASSESQGDAKPADAPAADAPAAATTTAAAEGTAAEGAGSSDGAEPAQAPGSTGPAAEKPKAGEPVDCPTCGLSIPGRSYARHQETCYAKNAGQVYALDPKAFGPTVESDLYCNFVDKDSKKNPDKPPAYCALLKASCPYHGDHKYRKKVNLDSVCGFRNPDTGEHCKLLRRNCSQHPGWEQTAASQLKQQRNQTLSRLWIIRDRIQTVKSRIRRRKLTQVVVKCVHRTIQEMGVVQ